MMFSPPQLPPNPMDKVHDMHVESMEQRDEMLDLLRQILAASTRQNELSLQIVELLRHVK